MESPTLSRTMATRMQEAILSWVGRVRADQEHKEYWSVVCAHYDRTLLETYHQCMADGMTRTAFLRSYRFQLQLFLCMGQATKMDMAVRAGELPGSSDLESLRKSSAIGAVFLPLSSAKRRCAHMRSRSRIGFSIWRLKTISWWTG